MSGNEPEGQRRARRHRQHRLGRGLRRPDRPGRPRRRVASSRDAADRARARAQRHPRDDDRARHHGNPDAAGHAGRGCSRRSAPWVPFPSRLGKPAEYGTGRHPLQPVPQRQGLPPRRRHPHGGQVTAKRSAQCLHVGVIVSPPAPRSAACWASSPAWRLGARRPSRSAPRSTRAGLDSSAVDANADGLLPDGRPGARPRARPRFCRRPADLDSAVTLSKILRLGHAHHHARTAAWPPAAQVVVAGGMEA